MLRNALTLTLDINAVPRIKHTSTTANAWEKRDISKARLQGYAGFAIDSTTGFSIDPGTGRIIDGSEPYCKVHLISHLFGWQPKKKQPKRKKQHRR